ncbi:MAG TPA: hypothetical protein VI072_33165 [Polyangiaceae bacterium]
MARLHRNFDDFALDAAPMDARWFSAPAHAEAVHPFAERRAPARPIGHAGWAMFFGAMTGAVGGLAMLKAADQVLVMQHSSANLTAMLSASVAHLNLGVGGAHEQALGVAMAAGALVGALFGFLARRLLRIAPRLLFFWLAVPIVWIFVQAVVMSRVAPHLTTSLPIVPLLVGALAFGTCVAIVPPVRARREREEVG